MSFGLAHESNKNNVGRIKTSISSTHSRILPDVNKLNRGSSDHISHLQGIFGNQTLHMPEHSNKIGFNFAKIGIQSKLEVSQSGEAYEQEADRVAEQIMGMSISSDSVVSTPTTKDERIYRKCAACEMKEKEEDEKQLNIGRKPSTGSNLGSKW